MNRKEKRTALQAYTEPEVVEVKIDFENTILQGSPYGGGGNLPDPIVIDE